MNKEDGEKDDTSKGSKKKNILITASAGVLLLIFLVLLLAGVFGCSYEPDGLEPQETVRSPETTTVSIIAVIDETTVAPTTPVTIETTVAQTGATTTVPETTPMTPPELKQEEVFISVFGEDPETVFLLVKITPLDGYKGEYHVTYDGQPMEYLQSAGIYQLVIDRPSGDTNFLTKLEWERK